MENKCKIFKKGNKQSGITLVALVVTIVVLLILAGISIRLVLDNNGIINKAGEGKEKYGQAKENEQTDLDNALDWIDEMTGANIVEPENVDDWAYRVEDDGTLTITGYKGTATEVVIPNSIDGVRVKSIYNNYDPIWDSSICNGDEYWVGSSRYVSQNTITSIIISYGIEKIGDSVFRCSTELKNVSIPNSVTSIDGAFEGCTSLTNITIPDSVTSIDGAFSGCTSLTSIDIPNSVTNISVAFQGCTGLTNITIPNSVTNMSVAFQGCTGLTNITIPDSVTNIESDAFYDCTSLTNVTIPNTVTSIEEYAFDSCSALTTVNYTGTEEQWKNITISTRKNPLTSAAIVYNYKE